MDLLMNLAFLFFIGSVTGWIIELLFRRFISSSNPERKWINPGFCTGPYLPLYGSGLCVMYLLSSLEEKNIIPDPAWNKIVLLLGMALCITAIEYIAGILTLKVAKVRLWDYRTEWGNVNGIICPKFSAVWTVLCALYLFLLHRHVLAALVWFSDHSAFSFLIGVFYGVFVIDVIHSVELVAKLKKFAEENGVIVKYEAVKEFIRQKKEKTKEKYRFFKPFHTNGPLVDHLRDMKDNFEKRIPKIRW